MLSVIDIPFLLICALLALHSCIKGFMSEFFSKLAIALGILCAVLFHTMLSLYLLPFVKNEFVAVLCAFALIFIVVYLIVRIVQQLLSGAVNSREILNGLDKVMGFFFGIVEGLLVCAVVLLLLEKQPWFDLTGLYKDSVFFDKLWPLLNIARKHGV